MTETQGEARCDWTELQKAKESLQVRRTSEIHVRCSTVDCLRLDKLYEDEEMSSERSQAWGVATCTGWTHDSEGNWSCPKCSSKET